MVKDQAVVEDQAEAEGQAVAEGQAGAVEENPILTVALYLSCFFSLIGFTSNYN